MKNFAFLLLLGHLIQSHASPGRNHHQQPSKSHGSHGAQWYEWGYGWDRDWFQPHTTQKARTRKSTSSRMTTQFYAKTTSYATTAPTPPQPVIRDVEIKIKPEQAADVSDVPSWIDGAVGSTTSGVTTITSSFRKPAQTENVTFRLFNTAEELATISPNERDQVFTLAVAEVSPTVNVPVMSVNTRIDTPISDDSTSHWHVGIYRKTEPYTQICGGTLIKADTVISAGTCFWTLETLLLPADQFAAAAGKMYRAWDDPRDVNAQYSDIINIRITRMFQPCLDPDLALVTLATPFKFDGAVKPACLQLTEKEDLTTNDIGFIAGWGVPSDNCKPSDRVIWSSLPFLNTLKCSPESAKLGNHANKICAGDSSNKTQCDTDRGSGLIFYNNTTPYLRGVATFVATDSLCYTFNSPSFSPVGRQLSRFDKAIEQLLKNISSSEECRSFYSAGQLQGTNQIQTGQMQNETTQSGPSELPSIDKESIDNGNISLVTIPPVEEIFFFALGTMSIPVPTLGNTTAPAYQWHVGVYSKAFTPFMQICGGTLVKLDTVISAAHCFWDDAVGQQAATQFSVAGGKLHRPWNSTKDTSAQFSDVSEILIPARFRGETTSFQDDVAILKLSTSFILAQGVRPACVSFEEALETEQLTSGNLGTVAGWGLTEANGVPSQRLNYLQLPYVDINDCFSNAEPSFLKYITSDKICAGDKFTGKALCRGDSGGGLIFFSGTTPYVRGVASTAPNDNNLCNAFAIATFTQLYAHRTFLRDNIPNVEKCFDARNTESGSTGNSPERDPLGTANDIIPEGSNRPQNGAQSGTTGSADMTGTGNRVVGNGMLLKPPEFIAIQGPTASKMTEATTVPPHLVPYNNFVCNCHCKN